MNILFQDDSDSDITIQVNPGDEVVVTDEAAEAESELDQLSIAITVTKSQAEEAEVLRDDISATMESGGLTPEASVFVHRNLAILDGINGKRATYFTVQNFQTAGGRKAYTMQALETVKEKIKTFWAKLKAFYRKWADKAYDFFTKHISGMGRLQKAFTSLVESANKKAGSPKGKIKVSPSVLKMLAVENGKLEPEKILLDGVAHVKTLPKVSQGTLDLVKKISDKASAAKDNGELTDLQPLMVELTTGFSASLKEVSGGFTGDPLLSKNVFPGGYKLQWKEEKRKADGAAEYIISSDVTPKIQEDAPEWKDDDEVEALDRASIIAVANNGKALCGAIMFANTEIYKTKKIYDGILQALDKAAERMEGFKEAPAAETASAPANSSAGTTTQDDDANDSTDSGGDSNAPATGDDAGKVTKAGNEHQAFLKGLPTTAKASMSVCQNLISTYGKSAQAAYTYASISLGNLTTK